MTTYFKRDSVEYSQQMPTWVANAIRDRGGSPTLRPMFVIGEDEDWQNPAAMILSMPAGYELFRHAHVCSRFEIVLDGSLITEDGTVLVAGDVMVARPHELYGPHVAGPNGVTTLEVFGALEGVYRMIGDGPDGPVEVDSRTGAHPYGYVPLPPVETASP